MPPPAEGSPPVGPPPAPSPPPDTLSVRDAYRLWAPVYHEETVVSALEDRIVTDLGPPPGPDTALLDAGCGTGRRIARPSGRPRLVVGVDLVQDMLRVGHAAGGARALLAAADARALPLPAGRFDLIWFRLVAGHIERLELAYAELGRTARPGATLVVSDFHPAAVAAGHRRTFRDAMGRSHGVEHHVHGRADHERAAAAAGWRVERVAEAPAGEPERGFYERAGRVAQYERERRLPLVLVLCLRR